MLAAPALECNFDETRLQCADGTPAAIVDFVKLNLFVRLWKKLGWTIDELDRALTPLLPRGSQPLTEANLGSALRTALIYLAHLNTLAGDLQLRRADLPALWTDISTSGRTSLYARLFLTPVVQKDDPVFDHPTGAYLSENRDLVEHRGAVQAALTISARDLEAILDDASLPLATARLTVPTVSLLYRYRLLAGALAISIADLITLKALSGLDPFTPLAANPLDPTSQPGDDHPFSQTLRFVEIARAVAASGFTIEELDYLLRQRVDPAGPYRPDERAQLTLVIELGRAIGRIRAENAPPADAAALDDETLRRQLALVLTADAMETFMGMWRGTIAVRGDGARSGGRRQPRSR